MVLDPTKTDNPQDNPNNQDPQGPAWRVALPEDIRGEKAFEVFKGKDVNEVFPVMAKSWHEAQKMIGSSIRIPKEDKPEEWSAIYGKLGRPETFDKYEINLKYPEFIEYDSAKVDSFKKAFHEAGLSNRQVQLLMDHYAENAAQEIKAKKDAFISGHNALREEWGSAFDTNYALAQRARDLFPEIDMKAVFREDINGNNPDVVRYFAKLGALLMEGDYLGEPGDTSTMTPSEAQEKITAIRSNPKDPYFDADNPGHNERVKEVEGLYQIAYNKI